MLRTRRLICLLALILARPSAAIAQGAGDDQYQDPFGDEPAAQQDGEGGIGSEPPTDGGSEGSGNSGSGGGGEPAPTDPAPSTTPTTPADPNALPRTGSDPRPLLLVGAAFLLGGGGLRLRTIDPDDF